MTDLSQQYPASTCQTEPPLELRLMGAFSLRVHGQEVSGLSRPARCLLALLVLHRNAPITRERLAEALWPDGMQERSAFYLRRLLTETRAVLGLERARLASPTRTTLGDCRNSRICSEY